MFPVECRIPRRTKDKNALGLDIFSVIYRYHWVRSGIIRHGSMIVQIASVQLWSTITGTRPGVLFPQNTSSPGNLASNKVKVMLSVPLSSFTIRRADRKALMGKKEIWISHEATAILILGNRTKLFMHGDYQLACCLITQIIAFALRDGAFANIDLTPELTWRLRVSSGSPPLLLVEARGS